MTVSLMPYPKVRFWNVAGSAPLAGGKLYSYEPGTSTPKATYTDSTGNTANTNPVVLDANGEATIWLNGFYKIILKDSTDVVQWTIDNVSSMPASSITQNEWLTNILTPTYINGTQFSVPGDETGRYQVGRRVKCTVTAGTVYGWITVSAYTTVTTVTVAFDSGSLDNGLSNVSEALLSATNHALPKRIYTVNNATAASHALPIGQAQGGAHLYAVDTGAADAYVVTLSPAITALTVGMIIRTKIINANTTSTPTLNLNGLGAKTITRNSGALMAGDIKANGYYRFQYYENGATGYFSLIDPTLTGNAELADSAVTNAKLGAGAVDAAKASGIFGTWDTSKSAGTVYQAATDLEVHALITSTLADLVMDGYTDSSNPPTVHVASNTVNSTSVGITFSVKKGHYWKAVKGANGTAYINVLPLGS